MTLNCGKKKVLIVNEREETLHQFKAYNNTLEIVNNVTYPSDIHEVARDKMPHREGDSSFQSSQKNFIQYMS